MAGNIFGKILRLSTFGESHGAAIGGVLEGMPAGLKIDIGYIQSELNRRRPGQSSIVSERNEADKVELLSGIKDGLTIGTPIGFFVRNKDVKSGDYDDISKVYRPSHADYTYTSKYGIREAAGGGRSSARETVSRVVAGALAKIFLNHFGVSVDAFVNRIGTVAVNKSYVDMDLSIAEESLVRCPDRDISDSMIELIEKTGKSGDSLGGEIICVIKNTPVGIGEPVFNKLNADLGHAILGINAVKGFEIGSGFMGAKMLGSEHNDPFVSENGKISTKSNYSGGIQGGISNGEDIYFKAAFKPVSTIMMDQETVDKDGNQVVLKGKGRHDVCVVPRAVPIVEAMAALVIADHILQNKSAKIGDL